ncbi:hypothetical protein TrRE_jg12333 [Triparma retinervis]|uniref:Phosphoglycerate mutase-like protein n=1 Tax=Triparma retinervis TaxID=2557542 RepID=A0A9W6ZJS3_9STRA|nr:hypothetical protein TrRE_jg12333 [Triparma retinervis]
MTTVRTIYLIRHAESVENMMIHDFKTLVGIFPPPQPGEPAPQVLRLFNLLNVPALVDCALSPRGVRQTEALKDFTSSYNNGKGFLPSVFASGGPSLVIHSPLRRARQTCAMATSLCSSNGNDPEYDWTSTGLTSPGGEVEVMEQPLLLEKTPVEWLPGLGGRLEARIESFKTWITTRPESSIVVVGHSQWFKKMLGMDKKFDNCDIWKVEFNDDEMEFGTPERLYQGNVE